jgi:hypothetical protein
MLGAAKNLEIRELSTEEAAIAREEAATAHLGVRADQEVRDQPRAVAATAAVLTPHSASEIGAVAIEQIERQASVRERTVHCPRVQPSLACVDGQEHLNLVDIGIK